MGTMTIKEAAKKLEVEAHVLRYWEDELRLDIKRNAQGHRYYDERDIRMFEQVKAMKEEGLMLKDIRNAIMRAKRMQGEAANVKSNDEIKQVDMYQDEHTDNYGKDHINIHENMQKDIHKDKHEEKHEHVQNMPEKCDRDAITETPSIHKLYDEDSMVGRMERVVAEKEKVVDFKQAQLQTVMNRVIANALRENKDIITTSIKQEVTADVMRQFDAVMREKEEREEVRYRRLDEVLREIQRGNAEAAATKAHKRFGKKRR